MGGATAFLTEYAPPEKRAYYSSWIQSSIGFAVLLGAATGTFVTTSLDTQALHSWGWRLPFLLGIIVGTSATTSAAISTRRPHSAPSKRRRKKARR